MSRDRKTTCRGHSYWRHVSKLVCAVVLFLTANAPVVVLGGGFDFPLGPPNGDGYAVREGGGLEYLETWNQRRRELALEYSKVLQEENHVKLTRYNEKSVYHLYVIRVNNRDTVLKKLNEANIGAGIHYPFAVHELNAYQWLGYKSGDFPVSEDWARTCLSLPIYAEMPEEAIDRAAAILKK